MVKLKPTRKEATVLDIEVDRRRRRERPYFDPDHDDDDDDDDDEEGLVSYDFTGAIGDAWEFVDPIDDCSFSITDDDQLALVVPSGTSHDAWPSELEAARLVQEVGDVDFEVEAKFDTVPSERFQIQGICVEEDEGYFIRFDFYSDGMFVRFFAATFVDGSPNTRQSTVVSISAGHRLRVGRVGDVWTASDSPDGVTWTQRTSFTHSMEVSDVGVMAGNAGASPAFTVLVDYFFDTSDPL